MAHAKSDEQDSIWKISENPDETRIEIPVIVDLEASAALIFENLDDEGFLSKTIQFAASSEFEATSWLWFNALLDTGHLSYEDSELLSPDEDSIEGTRSALDFFASGDPLREISLTTSYNGISLQLGRIPNSIGDGLIYSNYGFGAIARFDGDIRFDWPILIELSTQMVGSKWSDYSSKHTISSLHLEYELSQYESIYILGANYQEQMNNLTNVIMAPNFEIRQANMAELCDDNPNSHSCLVTSLQLTIPGNQTLTESTGRLRYIGIGGNMLLSNGLSLRGILIGMFGQAKSSTSLPPPVQAPPENRGSPQPDPRELENLEFDATFRAWATQLRATLVLNDYWEMGWEFFALSGNPTDLAPHPDTQEIYTSFVGISPYWAWSGIFFDSGLNRNAYASKAKAAGVFGRGVAGTGPTLNYTTPTITLELQALGLYALNQASSPFAAYPTYGIELNSIVDWKINRYLGLASEIDVFFPGNSYLDTGTSYRLLGFLNGQFNL